MTERGNFYGFCGTPLLKLKTRKKLKKINCP
jgi:hypothetical protein